MRRTVGALVPLLAIGQLSLPARQGQPPADQRPPVTFKSEINFVEIDAVVTDRLGRFVSGLTKDDFRILEEGKPQVIAAFDVVHIPVNRSESRSSLVQSVEPDTVSNRQAFNGRLFLMLLDDLQTDITRTAFVRKAAREFVDYHMAENDLVAVSFTSGRSMGQDFTGTRSRLAAAIDRFTGVKLKSKTVAMIEATAMGAGGLKNDPKTNAPPTDPNEAERTMRAKTSLEVLQKMSEYLGGIRGRRKALVYIGEGIDHELVDQIIVDRPSITRDTAGVRAAMREAVAAATRANVSVYTIDPRGLTTGLDEAIALPTVTTNPTLPLSPMRIIDELSRSHPWMRSVAEETGGIPFLNTNETSAPLARIIEDSSSYYILGYYAPTGRKDGRFRSVQVGVNRPGLEVRARRGYYGPGGRTSSAQRRQSESKASAELQDVLRSPLPVNGITFGACATPFQGTGQAASVALVVEVDPARLEFSDTGGVRSTDLELHVTATDPRSKTPANATHHLAELRLRPQTFDAVKAGGIRIIRRIELRPGRYRLQFAIREKTGGSAGSLFTDLDVPDFSGPSLAMSGITIVSAAASRIPTVEPDKALSLLLPGPPTTRREFPTNDRLAVFAEIYDNDLRMPHRVRVKTTVRNAEGTEVFTAAAEHGSDELSAASPGGARGGLGHRVTLPAESLGPGTYVLRVQAERTASDHLVSRELPFSIK